MALLESLLEEPRPPATVFERSRSLSCGGGLLLPLPLEGLKFSPDLFIAELFLRRDYWQGIYAIELFVPLDCGAVHGGWPGLPRPSALPHGDRGGDDIAVTAAAAAAAAV